MPGGSGTTIIGWDSNTEAGNIVIGTPTSAGKVNAVQLAAAASGSPNTAWIKVAAVDTDLIFCIWDAGTGALLAESNVLTTANQSAASGHWSSVTMASTSALTGATTYSIGVQQNGNYYNPRQVSTNLTPYWASNETATWPTPPNPISGYVYGSSYKQWSFYFSVESAAAQKGGMFFADERSHKLSAKALAMFMPLSWVIGRRRKISGRS